MKNHICAATAVMMLAACQAKNPDLTGAPPPPAAAIERHTVTRSGDGLSVTFDPRVDILFVIDDSLSMHNHQKKLSANIKKFVDEIAQVKAIDFHIGFTVAHDSKRYRDDVVPQTCVVDGKTRVNWEPAGSLQPLQGPADKLPKDGRRFVTRDDDFVTILSDSLDPDKNPALVKELINKTSPEDPTCPYGPEEEEIFTPLLNVLQDPTRGETTNKGFRREGAYFVAILISDAKSADIVSKGYTPEVVRDRLRTLTGEDQSGKKRFRVFSVAMKPGSRVNTATCKPDPAFAVKRDQVQRRDGSVVWVNTYPDRIGENPLATLAELTRDSSENLDQVLSICDDDYGSALARYGTQIKQDALADVVIELPEFPQVYLPTDDNYAANRHKNLSVWINDTELKPEDGQWSYDMNNVAVTVYAQKVDWDQFPDAKIHVKYVPVDAGKDTAKRIRF